MTQKWKNGNDRRTRENKKAKENSVDDFSDSIFYLHKFKIVGCHLNAMIFFFSFFHHLASGKTSRVCVFEHLI